MKPLIFGIAGPSGAGKSTVTKSIVKDNPEEFSRIKLDNYFNDIHGFPIVDDEHNWDVPSNIDFESLHKNLTDLKKGKNQLNFVNLLSKQFWPF